jgi:aflatoxin B1 aldehyde reductase
MMFINKPVWSSCFIQHTHCGVTQQLIQLILVAFYAYSPIAGGFLAKTQEQIKEGNLKGRWHPEDPTGKFYHHLYLERPALWDALATWDKIAASEGIPRAELAFRWVYHHSVLDGSKGDAVIIGASSPNQLRQTVAAFQKGPLSPAAQEQIQAMWESMKHEAFLDNIAGQSEEFKKKMKEHLKEFQT